MSNWSGMDSAVSNQICGEIDDLIEGYALGTLPHDEMLLVASRIGDCPEHQIRMHEYEETVGLLGLAVQPVSPSPELWTRLQASTRDETAPRQNGVATNVSKLITVPRWAASLAAALVLVLLASTIALGIALRGVDHDDESFEAMMTAYVTSGGTLMPLNSVAAPEILTWPAKGTLVMAPEMTPMLIVDDCVPDSDEFEYRVWVAIGEERTPLGRLSINKDGRGMMMLDGVDSLAPYDTIGITILTSDDHRYDVMEVAPNQEN